MATITQSQKVRLRSLDVLRGFDMFFIMGGDVLLLSLCWLFPGSWGDCVAAQLGHPAWHGFTAYDLIFPLFLFLAGISFPFSFSKQMDNGRSLLDIRLRIVKRGFILVLLGMVYNGILYFDDAHFRVASVLGRIGLAWMFAALLATWLGHRLRWGLVIFILLGYWALLVWVDAPDSDAGSFTMEGNIVSYIDRLLLPGILHNGIHDPEGLLATLPAVCTAMIGIEAGELVRKNGGVAACWWMGGIGVGLIVIALAWDIVFPINKNLWTSSFVCITGGLSLLMFSLFHYVIDLRNWNWGTYFFRVIGLNSITIYLAQHFFDFRYTTDTILGGIAALLPGGWSNVLLSFGYVMLCWLFLWFLHQKSIYLKV